MIANFFTEPDYKYEVFGDVEAVAVSADGVPGCEYYNVKRNGQGVAALHFTYGPIQLYKDPVGEGSLNISEPYRTSEKDKHSYWNPTNPIDAGVIIVSSASAADIEAAGISTNIALGEHDTVYFDSAKTDRAQYTFKPTANGDVTVRIHKPIHEGGAVWGQGWANGRKNPDGSFTVDLHEGRNIVEVGTDASTYKEYHVVNARGLKININNNSDPNWSEGMSFKTGEIAAVSFEGLRLPVEKIAGIYNPGYNNDVYVRYGTNDGRSLSSTGYGANVATNNTVSVPLTAPGDLWLTDGRIPTGWLGSRLGAHRIMPGTAIYPNLNASAVRGVFSLLPDIELSVGAESAVGGDFGSAEYTRIRQMDFSPGDGIYHPVNLMSGVTQNIDVSEYSYTALGNTFFIYTARDDVSVWRRRRLSTTSGIPAESEPLQLGYVPGTDDFSSWWTFGEAGREITLIEGEFLEGEKAGYVEFTVLPPEDKADYDPTTYAVRRVMEGGIGKHPYIMNLSLALDDRSYADYYSGRLKAVSEDGSDLGLGWNFLATRTNYVADVPNNVTSVTLRANPLVETDAEGESHATSVKVNGELLTSANGYRASVTLTGDETVITVTATAALPLEGASEPESFTYTIKIRKAGPPGEASGLAARDGEKLTLRTPSGALLTPGAGGKFSLAVAGGYRYALEKPGYKTRTGTFSVTADYAAQGIDLSAFRNSEKLSQSTGAARVTIIGAHNTMARNYAVAYNALEVSDLASRGYVQHNYGGYTVLHALTEALDANAVPYGALLGRVTPDDTPDGGVYGSGWVCDVNGEVTADYANTLVAPGDDIYFYYNPKNIGQVFVLLGPDQASVKRGASASFKPAGTDGDLTPIAGAVVLAANEPAGTTDEDGMFTIATDELVPGTYEIRTEYTGGGDYNILTYNSALLTVKADEPEEPGGNGDGKSETAPADTPQVNFTNPNVVTVPAEDVRTFKADLSDGAPSKEELAGLLEDEGIVSLPEGSSAPDLALNDAGEVVADVAAISAKIDAALEGSGEEVDKDSLLAVPLRVIEVPAEALAELGAEKAIVIFSSKIDLAYRFEGASLGGIIALKQMSDNGVERIARAASLEAISHGQHVWTDGDGETLPDSTRITQGGEYYLRLAVEDDSPYDWNKTPGIVADPVILAEDTSYGDPDGGSGGGCATGVLGIAFMLVTTTAARLAKRGKRK